MTEYIKLVAYKYRCRNCGAYIDANDQYIGKVDKEDYMNSKDFMYENWFTPIKHKCEENIFGIADVTAVKVIND